MDVSSDPKTALVLRAIGAIRDATTVEDALLGLVEVLRSPLQLWHASLGELAPDASRATVLASWSMAGTVFAPATEIATSISPAVRSAVEQLLVGEPIMGVAGDDPQSLVDQLFREEGVAAVVAVPLPGDGPVLSLMLGSGDAEVLESMGMPFFRSLGGGIRERMRFLAGRATA